MQNPSEQLFFQISAGLFCKIQLLIWFMLLSRLTKLFSNLNQKTIVVCFESFEEEIPFWFLQLTSGQCSLSISPENIRKAIGLLMYSKRNHVFSKFFWKANISYPLIRTRTCTYQGVRNVSFSQNFAYLLSIWSLKEQWPNLTGRDSKQSKAAALR